MKLQSGLMAAVAALTACTMEPHYDRPAAPVPATWTDQEQSSNNTTPASQMGWRDFFPDKNMQRLIEIALANNRDLRVAALNVQATQAQYRIQRSDLFPTIAATGLEQIEKYPSGVTPAQGGTGTGGSVGTAVSTGGQTIRFYEAGVGFTSYEIDLFGRIRSLNHEAFEKYLSSEETRRSTQLSLIAQVVSVGYTLHVEVGRSPLAGTGAWLQPPLWLAVTLLVAACFLCAFGTVIVAQGRTLFPDRLGGRGVTTVNMAQCLGLTVLPALTGYIVEAFGADDLAYRYVFATLAAGLVIGLIPYSRSPDNASG